MFQVIYLKKILFYGKINFILLYPRERFVTVILSLSGKESKMRKFWNKGDQISSYYKTQNIILHLVQVGKGHGRTVIIGNGHSMSINSKGVIIKVEPCMTIPHYVEKFNANDTVYDLYYTFECTGLNEAARDLANFIATNELGEDIWLIGHSKCGVCFYKAIEYISTYLIRSKIYLVTISAPFNGTIMASNRFKKIPKRMNFLLNFVHGLLFSDHAVDKDISPHSEFLSSLPCESYVLRVCTHYNICSTLVETHFWECKGVQEKFCKFLAWATRLSDGIVKYSSQFICPEDYVCTGKFSQGVVFAGHTESLEAGIDLLLSKDLDFQFKLK